MKFYQNLCTNSKILDIGCGGGNPFLKIKDFYVVGIDVSFAFLMSAKEIYDKSTKQMSFPYLFPMKVSIVYIHSICLDIFP